VYSPISLRIVFTPVGDFLVLFAACYRSCYCWLLLQCVLWMKYINWKHKKVKVSTFISQTASNSERRRSGKAIHVFWRYPVRISKGNPLS
jgi:hypothetical protein